MKIQLSLILIDVLLINLGFLISYLIRYGSTIPNDSFLPYRNSFIILTSIYITCLLYFGAYKTRFRSSWELAKRIFCGICLGTLLCIALVYVFRMQLGAFPTSVFLLSSSINPILIFKTNQLILKKAKKIKKRVIVLGCGQVDNVIARKNILERKRISQIHELFDYPHVDEIVVSEKVANAKDLNLLLYLSQKMKAEVLFNPSIYMELLPERINETPASSRISTFVGRRSDFDEFSIRLLDIATCFFVLLVSLPIMLFVAILIKISSPGPAIYTQQRVGKDGRIFTLYKFRTMINNAEKLAGFLPAMENDPRITKIGSWLRQFRIDELPQLFNILRGDMSIVGPRPENLSRVSQHKALQGIRLAVRPGLTGLAQIRSSYDLHPIHKIKYDYLYIQQRSLPLNLYILAKTIPVILSRRGSR